MVLVSTPDNNPVQAAPPLPSPPANCTEGLFHYQKLDEFTLQITLDYHLNLNTGKCVVIDKACPSFFPEDMIAYSDCAPPCLLPGAENPC